MGPRRRATPDAIDFDDHRWARYLTVIGRMQDAVDVMESRWRHHLPGDVPRYMDFVRNRARERPYQRNDAWRSAAVARTNALLTFASCAHDMPDFLADAPEPDRDLRVTAHF